MSENLLKPEQTEVVSPERRTPMDHAAVTEIRQRVARLVEEAGSVLGMIPGVLDENEELRVSFEGAQREADRTCEQLIVLKNEVAQLRKERDEITGMCTSAMSEMAEVMNEMIGKLRAGQKSSPFSGERAVPSEPASRPAPAGWTGR
jgi:chromosome segregation ATPase